MPIPPESRANLIEQFSSMFPSDAPETPEPPAEPDTPAAAAAAPSPEPPDLPDASAAAEPAAAEPPDTPDTPSVLDLDATGDHLVTVTVDGTETQMPLRDIVSRHELRADIDRRQTAVRAAETELEQHRRQSALYQRMQERLSTDPEGFLRRLAAGVGVSLDTPSRAPDTASSIYDTPQPGSTTTNASPPAPSGDSELSRAVAELAAEVGEIRQHIGQQAAATQWAEMRETYKVPAHITEQDVISYAQTHGVNSFDVATKAMMFERQAELGSLAPAGSPADADRLQAAISQQDMNTQSVASAASSAVNVPQQNVPSLDDLVTSRGQLDMDAFRARARAQIALQNVN